MQPFEYRSVRYWSKETNGTLTGAQKQTILESRYARAFSKGLLPHQHAIDATRFEVEAESAN